MKKKIKNFVKKKIIFAISYYIFENEKYDLYCKKKKYAYYNKYFFYIYILMCTVFFNN